MEIYCTYEFIPTMTFEAWAPPTVTNTPSSAFTMLKSILDNDLVGAVAGEVGAVLTGKKAPYGLIKPAFNALLNYI